MVPWKRAQSGSHQRLGELPEDGKAAEQTAAWQCIDQPARQVNAIVRRQGAIMNVTHFETYLHALDACADPQGVLGEEWVLHPPNPDYGYESTPRNALTFGRMGVDGVHYAILKIKGVVEDDSPVIQVCPMDFSDLYQVLGESFLSFLAGGCGVTRREMESVFATERAGEQTLVTFLKERFEMSRLWEGKRSHQFRDCLEYIEIKP